MNSYIVSNGQVPPFRQWVDAETPEQAIELFRLRCVADGRPVDGISAQRMEGEADPTARSTSE